MEVFSPEGPPKVWLHYHAVTVLAVVDETSITLIDRCFLQHPLVSSALPNASDAGGSPAGFGLRTSGIHQFVIESPMWKRPRAAAGFAAKTLRWSTKLVALMRPMPSMPLRAVAGRPHVSPAASAASVHPVRQLAAPEQSLPHRAGLDRATKRLADTHRIQTHSVRRKKNARDERAGKVTVVLVSRQCSVFPRL